jgi:hypothetical protein
VRRCQHMTQSQGLRLRAGVAAQQQPATGQGHATPCMQQLTASEGNIHGIVSNG